MNSEISVKCCPCSSIRVYYFRVLTDARVPYVLQSWRSDNIVIISTGMYDTLYYALMSARAPWSGIFALEQNACG